ncbi:MAG: acyltransferase, partial [Gammaproteobacteria bacterium]
MLKKIYLSFLGRAISFFMNIFSIFHKPFMVYGFNNNVKNKFYKRARISSTVAINKRSKLDLEDNVWVWHNSILDATNGIKIGRGSQIGANVCIFTHSSHISIRLLGNSYLETNVEDRIGYINEGVEIGEYTFIGSGSLIFPGVKIGSGCLVTSGSVVTESMPNGSIVRGNPAKVVAGTEMLDRNFFQHEIVQNNYYN